MDSSGKNFFLDSSPVLRTRLGQADTWSPCGSSLPSALFLDPSLFLLLFIEYYPLLYSSNVGIILSLFFDDGIILTRIFFQIQIIFLVTIFIVTLIFTIHIYHHSHFSPHPWRQHCATQPPFPISRYVQEEPVGLFVGVMSMASEKAAIQRQAIRESWAGHWASRGRWDEGQIWNPSEMNETSLPDNIRNPTSRVVVRFIMGWPTPEFRAAIREEMQGM